MEILPGLFLGNAADSERMLNVDMVVNCTANLPFHAELAQQVRVCVEDNGLSTEVDRLFQILADTELLGNISSTLAQHKTVLVHCKMGQQRSAAVVAAYIMYVRSMDPMAAMNYVRLRKPDAFFYQANFEAALHSLYKRLT